jgi:hypothetical protein
MRQNHEPEAANDFGYILPMHLIISDRRIMNLCRKGWRNAAGRDGD